MAISKRELTHIGFAPRHAPDADPGKGSDKDGAAAEMPDRPIFSTGPRRRNRSGIARVAAAMPFNPIFDDRSAQAPMTPWQDAGMFALTRAEIGRSSPLKAEWQ